MDFYVSGCVVGRMLQLGATHARRGKPMTTARGAHGAACHDAWVREGAKLVQADGQRCAALLHVKHLRSARFHPGHWPQVKYTSDSGWQWPLRWLHDNPPAGAAGNCSAASAEDTAVAAVTGSLPRCLA